MARNIGKRAKQVEKPPVKPKFVVAVEGEETFQQQALPRFSAATVNQKLQLQYLREGRSIVFSTGAAGSGKSMIAAYHAACLLKEKKIDKILLVRPVVYVGNSIGMLSGTADEKLSVWFKQTVAHLEKFLGVGFTRYCLDKGIIQYQALEHFRGMSLENCFCILEECQGLTSQEIEMVITRIGKGGQICLTGDSRQSAKKDNSGLTDFMRMLKRVIEDQPEYLSDEDLDILENDIGIVEYTVEDIQRSGVVKAFCKIYYNN
jgi:phosphate starvation-inducible PhoH-like protein